MHEKKESSKNKPPARVTNQLVEWMASKQMRHILKFNPLPGLQTVSGVEGMHEKKEL